MQYLTATDHLAALLVTALLATVLIVAARRKPSGWTRWAGRALGVVIVANELIYFATNWSNGTFSLSHSLPLYLCDVAAFVAGVALWWPRPVLVELTYFWGLAGSIQGLLTPDSNLVFPRYDYFQYYVDHCGVILAALFLVAGLRIQMRAGSVRRVFLLTIAFTAFVAVCDVTTGGDYMYLRSKPGAGSLLSVMGPWPWYIASGTLVALLFLLILDAPFRQIRRMQHG